MIVRVFSDRVNDIYKQAEVMHLVHVADRPREVMFTIVQLSTATWRNKKNKSTEYKFLYNTIVGTIKCEITSQ